MYNLFDKIFETFVQEGRELTPRELKNSHPALVNKAMRMYPGATLLAILKKVRRAYDSRWGEIDPKPQASLTILDKMRIAASKK